MNNEALKDNPNRVLKLKYASAFIAKNLPKNFCSAPFTQMFIYPTGDVFVCCEGNGYLGNLKENTIEQLWNGSKAKRIRNEFLSGNIIECKKNIACKGCNKGYTEQLVDIELQEEQANLPKHIDLIVNGKCNISCIMCEVKNEEKSLYDIPNFKIGVIEKIGPQLKTLSLKSGEPFVQKETYQLINDISNINPNCYWKFTTSGQFKFNNIIEKALNKIKVENITVSVDSINTEIYEKIRVGGTLKKCLDTINNFTLWSQTQPVSNAFSLNINITLQVINRFDIAETYQYFLNKKMKPHVIPVEKPFSFSLESLTDDDLVTTYKFYLSLKSSYNQFIRDIYPYLESIAQKRKKNELSKLCMMLRLRIDEYIEKSKQICSLPFTQISIYPDGSLKPCCWLPTYNLKKDSSALSFSKVWNDQPIKDLRNQFITGETTTCNERIEKVQCNMRKSLHIHDVLNLDEYSDKPLQKLHWYISGKCNLECPSCYNWRFDQEHALMNEYWQKLQVEVLPNICELEIVGGEPFFQKRTYEIIDYVASVNPLCMWYLTTNGQFEFKGKIADSLKKIRIANMSVSIDSLHESRFSKIRKNGELKKSLKFLDDLISYQKTLDIKNKFQVMINFVLQKDNYEELTQMIHFAKEKNTFLYIIPMVDPSNLSIYQLSVDRLIEIQNQIKNIKIDTEHTNVTEIDSSISKFINKMQKNYSQVQI